VFVKPAQANRRIPAFACILALILVSLAGRSFYLQVVRAAEYAPRAERQQLARQTIPVKRGIIYDRDGDELAVSKRMATVAADPTLVEDKAAAARLLAPMLQLEEADILTKLASPGNFVYVARRIEPVIGECVSAMDIPGIIITSEDKRMYPNDALASQILGYVGTDNVGLAGIELQYDRTLSGEDGSREVLTDLSGRALDIVAEQAPREALSITLTIDKDIQYFTEQVLTETVEKHEAARAGAVVLDPRTGEIIAMANTPIFDANDFGNMPPEAQRNACITDQFEPGSTFKMVLVAAALSAGIVTPETVYKLSPSIQVWDRVVHEAHEDVPDVREMSVTDILAQSSNVGAVTLGLDVGKERLVQMIRDFGFTKKLGVDFPGEVSGMMLDPDKWSGATIANVPIGHGISASALQLAAAYAAVANGGVLVQPHLARGQVDLYAHRVVSEEVAAKLRSMLAETVSEGTGRAARLEGYTVAGKTGTAQKVKKGGGGYSHDEFLASFIGMVPAASPRLVILVWVDEPMNGYLGSEVAAPAFARIATFALTQLGIPPSEPGQ
jgi:cell division protein FtsI/penicillin-binding protein 2